MGELGFLPKGKLDIVFEVFQLSYAINREMDARVTGAACAPL